jgi:hypothetical protein
MLFFPASQGLNGQIYEVNYRIPKAKIVPVRNLKGNPTLDIQWEQKREFGRFISSSDNHLRLKILRVIPFLFEDAPYKTDAKLHTVAAIHELPLRE